MSALSPEAITARPGQRVDIGGGVYATVGHGIKREFGCVFRQFLWLMRDGKPYPITDPAKQGREEWLCIKDAPGGKGGDHAA